MAGRQVEQFTQKGCEDIEFQFFLLLLLAEDKREVDSVLKFMPLLSGGCPK